MGFFVFILVVAALAGGVVWNHKTAAAAAEGVEFQVAAPPAVVANALRATYCGGAKASLRSVVTRMTVTESGAGSFLSRSSIGDTGSIDVFGEGSTSTVRARATSLYIGAPPATRGKSGLYGLASAMTHGAYTVLRIAPNAGKMKRFHAGVERKIDAQLRKAVA